MKERLKSLLLVVLVLSSLFLTYQLWYGRNPVDEISEDVYERVYFEEPRPLEEAVAPRYLLLPFHGDKVAYLLRKGDPQYDILWNCISAILQDAGCMDESRGEPAHDAELRITLVFDPALPAGQGSPWLKGFTGDRVSEIGVWDCDETVWITIRDPDRPDFSTAFLLHNRCASAVGELLAEFLPEEKHLHELLEPGALNLPGGQVVLDAPIYVPAGEPEMDEVLLREEQLDPEMLLRTFFVNRSLVRVIEERDGSLIFTDGEKALQLGFQLEYSHPQLAQDPVSLSYSGALGAASKLLGYYGGWPDNLRLESLFPQQQNLSEECYHAGWSYFFEGYPFFGKTGVWMVFNDRGMVEYRRWLFESFLSAGNPFNAPHYQQAIQAVLELMSPEEKESGSLVLEQAGLGYLVCKSSYQPVGVPVWEIGLDGSYYYLCARSLSLLEVYSP